MNSRKLRKPGLRPERPESDRPRWIPSTARVGGRSVTDHQKQLFREFLPQILLALPEIRASSWNVFGLPDGARVHLEIGFGSGEFMCAQAAADPGIIYIGCESYIRGVGRALPLVEENPHRNIRLWIRDARLLMEMLPDASLERVNILFPDPWPKKRHHKRRIISMEFLDMLGRVLKPGGTLLFATDIPHYAAWTLERVLAHPEFVWEAESMVAIRLPPTGWVPTRYQQKAEKEGRRTAYILCRRCGIKNGSPLEGERAR